MNTNIQGDFQICIIATFSSETIVTSWGSSLLYILLHILKGNSYGQNDGDFQQAEIGKWVTGCIQTAARTF